MEVERGVPQAQLPVLKKGYEALARTSHLDPDDVVTAFGLFAATSFQAFRGECLDAKAIRAICAQAKRRLASDPKARAQMSGNAAEVVEKVGATAAVLHFGLQNAQKAGDQSMLAELKATGARHLAGIFLCAADELKLTDKGIEKG